MGVMGEVGEMVVVRQRHHRKLGVLDGSWLQDQIQIPKRPLPIEPMNG